MSDRVEIGDIWRLTIWGHEAYWRIVGFSDTLFRSNSKAGFAQYRVLGRATTKQLRQKHPGIVELGFYVDREKRPPDNTDWKKVLPALPVYEDY